MDLMQLLFLIAIIIGLAVLNLPIYVVIFSATVYLQLYVNNMSLAITFNSMVESIAKSSLMCVPFFILAGGFMQTSSLGTRLVDLFAVGMKNVRGGLAISGVLSNALFGAISGSSPAAVATFGRILCKPLDERYGARLSLGVIASSGALSAIIPPSITIIIYAVATSQSTATMFMAGFVPGLLIVAIVSVYLFFRCKPGDRPGDSKKEETKESSLVENTMTVGAAFKRSIPVLVLPVFILGCIYGGIATPTEVAALAAIYAVVCALVLRDFTLKSIPGIIKSSMKTVGQVMILIATSISFAQAANVAGIPRMVTEAFSGFGALQFLLVLNLLLLVVGCFFETSSAILILSPLLLPTALSLGINPVHLGMIFTVNLAIGMFTPPFGLNLFVVQGVLGKSIGETSRAVAPFIVLYFIACLIITYVPRISLFLPQLLLG